MAPDDAPPAPASRPSFAATLVPRLFFSLFLLAGLAVFWLMFLRPLGMAFVARSWERTPCRILASEVQSIEGSESATYRVAITYRYNFHDQPYTSARYNFDTGSSSLIDWKEKVVADNPPGSERSCFVDPANPAEAVLDRGVGHELWWGLFALPFILVGCGAIVSPARLLDRRRRATATRQSARDSQEPAAPPGWSVLKPAAPRGQYAYIILIVALFWNVVTTALLLGVIYPRNPGSKPEWLLILFALLFVLVGLVLLAGGIHRLLARFLPALSVRVQAGGVRLGGSLGVEWEFAGSARRIRVFRVSLEGVEVATYNRGTNKMTERRVFVKEELFTNTDPLSMSRGATRLHIPADSMHTFTGTHNAILWQLRLHGEIPLFPDLNDEFAIEVGPLPPTARS